MPLEVIKVPETSASAFFSWTDEYDGRIMWQLPPHRLPPLSLPPPQRSPEEPEPSLQERPKPPLGRGQGAAGPGRLRQIGAEAYLVAALDVFIQAVPIAENVVLVPLLAEPARVTLRVHGGLH